MTAPFTISFRSFALPVQNSPAAAVARLSEIREEANQRAAALVPGSYWTAALTIPDVKFENRLRDLERRVALLEGGSPPAVEPYVIGAMTAERANLAVAAGTAIFAALGAAEAAILAVLEGTGTEEEKVAAIDAIWPVWPDQGEA